MNRQDKSIAYLDGIRGLAAIGVFFNHFSLAFYPAWDTLKPGISHLNGLEIAYTYSVFSFLNNGNFFVSVFFVLSGYVLSHKYLISNNAEVVVSGLFRRFLRLFIPITSVIIISYILLMSNLYFNDPVAHISLSDWYVNLWQMPNPTAMLVKNILFGSSLFIGVASFDTCLWTMSWEFYGSLFVFAFLLVTHFTQKYRLLFLFFAMYYFFIMGLPLYQDMLLGITLFYVEQRVKNMAARTRGMIAMALVPLSLVLGSVPFSGVLPDTWQNNIKDTLWDYSPWIPGIAAYGLVLAFVLSPLLQKIASARLLSFLGYISFALYLLHPIIIGSFASWVFMKQYDGANYNQSVLTCFVAMIPVMIAASWLLSKYIDQPGIRFAKKVYNLIREPKKIPQST